MREKVVVFDIGNVILNFREDEVITNFFEREKSLGFNYIQDEDAARQFIKENIINSPEWLGQALIDTGYVSVEEAIDLVDDRTDYRQAVLVDRFWNTYVYCCSVDKRVMKSIKELKKVGYKVYLLSNNNEHMMRNNLEPSGLFDIVDGGTYSCEKHHIKPHRSIYKDFLVDFELKPEQCVFIDNSQRNIDTALELGFDARLVRSDNYEDVKMVVDELLRGTGSIK